MEDGRNRSPTGRPDVMENVLWEHGIHLMGPELYLLPAIHQKSIVIPENIDAVRARLNLAPSAGDFIEMTDGALGIPQPGSERS